MKGDKDRAGHHNAYGDRRRETNERRQRESRTPQDTETHEGRQMKGHAPVKEDGKSSTRHTETHEGRQKKGDKERAGHHKLPKDMKGDKRRETQGIRRHMKGEK